MKDKELKGDKKIEKLTRQVNGLKFDFSTMSSLDKKLQTERRKKFEEEKAKAWEKRKKNLNKPQTTKYKNPNYNWLKN